MSKRQRSSVALSANKDMTTLDFKLSLLKSTEPSNEWTSLFVSSEVMCVLMTTDEKLIIAGQSDGTISLFKLGEETEERLGSHKAEVKCIASTSDSAVLISGSYDTLISVWGLTPPRKISDLEGHTSNVLAVVVTNDDKHAISSSNDRTVLIWNLLDLNLETKIDGLSVIGYSLSLSTDSSLLAVGCNDSTIRVWSFRESREQFRLVGHEMPIYSLCISDDMSFIVSASIDKTVRKWSLKNGKQERVIGECNDSIRCVTLTSDDKYAIYGRYNGRLTIASVVGAFEEVNIPAFTTAVNCLYVTKSSNFLISGSNECNLKVHKLSDYPTETILEGHKREINNIDISPDYRYIASASHDHSVLIWSFSETSPIGSLQGHKAEVYCVAFTGDSRCISGGVDEVLKVWDLQNFSQIEDLKGHEESVRSLAVTPDDKKVVSGSMDKTIRVWSLKSYEEIFVLKGHEFMVNCVASKNSKYAVSGSNDHTIRVWDIRKGVNISILKEHKAEISSIAITTNKKKFIAGGRDGRVSIWSMKFHHLEAFLISDDTTINKLCLSGDSLFIFTQHENKTIKLWSLPDKQLLGNLYEHKKILSLASSGDNEWLVISTTNKLRIIRSPLSSKVQYTIVPYEYSFLFRAQVYRLLHGNQKALIQDCLNCVFLPWNVNLLHVISYMNFPKLLKLAISQGAKFLGSEAGETPLTVSLKRRSKFCAEILIKRIPRELYEKNNSIFEYIGEILGTLNRASLRSLHTLYDAAFPVVTDKTLPKFGKFLRTPPIIILSDNPSINSQNFLDITSVSEELVDIEIEFRQSLLKLDLEQGSEESIKFIKTLKHCKNPEVFRSELVKVILLYKWRQNLPALMSQACVYLCLVIALMVQTVIRDSPGTLIVILFFNTLFLIYEGLQLKMRLRSYFLSYWNILDLTRIFFLYAYPILVFSNSGNRLAEDTLLAIANAMCWIRLIGFVRVFDQTRYMIRMCAEVVKEMGPFMLIFITAIAGLVLSYYAESSSVYSFKELVVNIYSLSYGQFNIDGDTELQKFVFVVASIILTLILLNLIIALMGDVFQQVKSAIDIADRREMASIILEVDSIMWLRRFKKKVVRKYIQQCSIAESRRLKNESQQEMEEILQVLANIEQRSKITDKTLKDVFGTFSKIQLLDKTNGDEKVIELLGEIKAEIKDTKKEIRLEMMKTKLDIAEIRKEVGKIKTNK
ncbi:hypothetical protein SteCoe_30682 [Stentor coeruleus]|uniref:Ion transport domain-containing protein n=1 Tax=Stentor coeruleus TaxID=5963 RepID=A0A1R2B358_9CILI|nr:hypothetical protein SteCoe_30682 [Stentor coeruleus]